MDKFAYAILGVSLLGLVFFSINFIVSAKNAVKEFRKGVINWRLIVFALSDFICVCLLLTSSVVMINYVKDDVIESKIASMPKVVAEKCFKAGCIIVFQNPDGTFKLYTTPASYIERSPNVFRGSYIKKGIIIKKKGGSYGYSGPV